MLQIRLARESDAAGILEIYTPYIELTSFTFETEPPSIGDFEKRIHDYMRTWPWLVCEIDGIIGGYAYATRHRERRAYQWCVECSVYIHENYQRSGIAKALYSSLFEILKKQGFRNVYAVINLPNDKSVKFHEHSGFTWFATYEKIGYKLGKWKNVGWWRLVINEFTDEPEAPVPLSALAKEFLPQLFNENIKGISVGK